MPIKKILKKKIEEVVPAIEVSETQIRASEPQAPSPNACPSCNGSGRRNAEDLCLICQGTGRALGT